MVPRLLKKKQK